MTDPTPDQRRADVAERAGDVWGGNVVRGVYLQSPDGYYQGTAMFDQLTTAQRLDLIRRLTAGMTAADQARAVADVGVVRALAEVLHLHPDPWNCAPEMAWGDCRVCAALAPFRRALRDREENPDGR